MTVSPQADVLHEVWLTPVYVFGAEGGYGLGDATGAQSDCNRARGHIFRVDDLTSTADRVRIRVLVDDAGLASLAESYEA